MKPHQLIGLPYRLGADPLKGYKAADSLTLSKAGTIKQVKKFLLSPTTKDCSIYCDDNKAFSNGAGAIFFPPEVTIILFFLSVIFK